MEVNLGDYVTIRTNEFLTLFVQEIGPNGEVAGTIEGFYEFKPEEIVEEE